MAVFHVKPTFAIYRMNEFSEKRHGKLALQNINLFSLIVKEGVREEAISLGLQVILKGYLKQTNKQTNKKTKTKAKITVFIDAFFKLRTADCCFHGLRLTSTIA